MSRSPEVMGRRVTADYVSVRDAARLLGRGESTIRRWIVDRRLPAYRDHGGGVLIRIVDLRLPPITEEPRAGHH